MIIDHLGIVVRSLPKGITLWQDSFGYEQYTEIIVNTRQMVKVVFMHKKDSLLVKLLEPVDKTSPVFTFARRGGGLHHICFKCGDLDVQLDALAEQGMRILANPQPGEAFDNNDIAFVFAGQGLNVELIDTSSKAGILVKE